MKKTRTIIAIIAAAVIIGAAVAALIIYREEISNFFTDLRDKLCAKKETVPPKDEFDDYADV